MRLLPYAIAVAAIALYPALVDDFYIDLMTRCLIFGLFALSADLMWGYCGILSLGQSVFFGLGAYGYTMVAKNSGLWGTSYLAILTAVLVAVALAVAIVPIGYHTWPRTDPRKAWKLEVYFAIITLAIALIVEKIAIVSYSVTGGYDGLISIPRITLELPLLGGWELFGYVDYYVVVAAICLVAYYLSDRLVRSPTGAVMIAIRDNPERTDFLGYDINRYRAAIFVLAAGMAALAGALYAPLTGIVTPDLFGFLLSFQVLMWVAIGGRGTLIGAFIGAILMTTAETLLSDVAVHAYLLAVGGIFVVVVIFFPNGIMGFVRNLRVGGRRERRA